MDASAAASAPCGVIATWYETPAKVANLAVQIKALEDTSPYKDSELNKHEGNRNFWGSGIVVGFLLLWMFCVPFRYFACLIIGVAALDHFSNK